ncbi:MAG: amidase domain-containing protein [Acetobacterium woodii]|nr:amidase domain-containing protein [Acetobacterium woodii]
MKRRRILKRKRKRVVICLALMTLMAMGVICVGVLANSYTLPESLSDNSVGENPGADSGTVKLREGEEEMDDEMLKPITEYFETYFQATANLETTDITALFEDPFSENAWINQSAMDYLIKMRLNQSNDLKMTDYQCGLTVTSINEEAGMVEVTLFEDHTVNFAFIPDVVSSSSGIAHTFYLDKTADGYVIAKHYKEEDSFLMLEEAVADSYEEPEVVAEDLLDNSLSVVEELSSEKESFNSGEVESWEPEVDNEYDAVAAIDYAMRWVDPVEVVRNDEKFGVYDTYGGNCNNYISQCLNAGGIPMDYFGDVNTQWKWYGEEIDLDEYETGRSPAWAGVEEFYTYANENDGYGLEAIVDDNVYSGSVGDILQYGQDDEWLHSVIITDVVTDSDGNMLDYLINSNTTDRINYPASAYGYSELRLIKILGWNNGE